MLGFNQFLRQLTTALIAFAIVVVAVGTDPGATHAMSSGSVCSSFADAAAPEDIRLVQDLTSVTLHSSTLVGHFRQDNPSKKADGASKSPCCGSYCSSAFSLADHSAKSLTTGGNDKWSVHVQSLTSAGTIGFKRPPRTASNLSMPA